MNAKILLIITLFFLQKQLVFSQCTIIEKIQDYKKTVKIKHSNLMFNDCIDSSTFSIKTYMEMYPALKTIKRGYVFDYHYFDNFSYGRPYIYVRNKKFNLAKHVNNLADRRKLIGEERTEFMYRNIYDFLEYSLYRAKKNIFPEDTEEGYIQYLYFYEMGELFALKWHAAYKEKQVICTENMMKNIVEQYIEKQKNEIPDFEVDTIKLQNLLGINELINKELNTDNCIIKWIEIEPFHGIYERTYKIIRKEPYTIELINEKQLVEIRQNFIY